jgi:hypothetical protein
VRAGHHRLEPIPVRQRAGVEVPTPREPDQDLTIDALALEDVQNLAEAHDFLDELLEGRAGDGWPTLAAQREIPGPQLNEMILERRLVLQVLLLLAPLHPVERRLGDEQVSPLEEFVEVPVEERE